ncbi:MAG: chromosome segregation protein SMC [Zoogloeaceae bacterium]|jgi:chromosome segregation protein|nr:chromosome segregation protein SMC [Zoogloeaceae bacterium]
MRLVRLKLSGFKSFVDPTVVALPGQLVGVVGPNGCGKSNLMDATRWVLGESKASELRGESMQDVIFNGSTYRKPVARASVELVFDNSLGRASGQWSQYAELSVKRVLTRNGQSDYFINQLRVRRKDVTDLFMGTGLGPRAYAIIGQGMISRVIEAKPEDLRVFLEEAAGVTRYKERRREAEGCLEDARENLLRVEDIRQELAARTEKLEAQASVARRYHALQEDLTKKQWLLWLRKGEDARADREQFLLASEKAQTEQEGLTARLRALETELEKARERHFAAGEALHEAQGALYAANAEAVRLESEIRHSQESRRQSEARLSLLSGEAARWTEETKRLSGERERWLALHELAIERLRQSEEKLVAAREVQPRVEAQERAAREDVETLKRDRSRQEQLLQVEITHRSHAERALMTLSDRRGRLEEEAARLSAQDIGAIQKMLEDKESRQLCAVARKEKLEEELLSLRESFPAREKARGEAAEEAGRKNREAVALEARQETLLQLQRRDEGRTRGEQLPVWFLRYGLDTLPPLWKSLQVESGWEIALEAVLRERLNALCLESAKADDLALWSGWQADRPGARLSVCFAGTREERASETTAGGLLEKVKAEDARWRDVLNFWLAEVRVAATLTEALARREELQTGACFVTPEGDRIERRAVHFFAPDARDTLGHTLLERRREIEALSRELAAAREFADQAQERSAALNEESKGWSEREQRLRREYEEASASAHTAQVEALRLVQTLERRREEISRIDARRAELNAEERLERERAAKAEENTSQLRARLDALRARQEKVFSVLRERELSLRAAREEASALDREAREAEFSKRECAGKLEEISAQEALAHRELARIDAESGLCRQTMAEQRPEAFTAALHEALAAREKAELRLRGCREGREEAEAAQKALEEGRMTLEQNLEPLREHISALKLKEQAAALQALQMDEQLSAHGCDESSRAPLVVEAREVKPQTLTQKINALQKEISDLGAVNLAALEELEAACERKGFLDEQAADLNEAMEVLESAIRRVDKETRALLRDTFETVNARFGQLFPELFGGGRAALVMTGEEILDAGVQVFAQPPGKKNATIHLLSGGEKALTAIALVFSIFQLNPAPFCLLDEVDAPLDDSNTERFCQMVKKMSGQTQFLFISHNRLTMEMAEQLVGVTMQESGVSRIVEVDVEAALKMAEEV